MTPQTFLRIALEPALSLLPAAMDTPPARALVLAICLQESRLLYRRQIRGPARGFAQFELGGGVTGVLTHSATRPLIERVLAELRYVPAASACYDAIEHHDVLACVFARLLLWTDAAPLPARDQADVGWDIYLRTWRPGRPHPDTWSGHFACAWAIVEPAGPSAEIMS